MKKVGVLAAMGMWVFLVLSLPAYGAGIMLEGPGLGPANGQFEVLIQSGSGWVSAGTLSYDKYISAQTLDLGGYVAGTGRVGIKLEKHGGGKAHLDAILLGAKGPTAVKPGSSLALKKLSAADNDLLDYSDGMQFTFVSTGKELTLAARIESEPLPKEPVALPERNAFHPVGANSKFYDYTLGANPGSLEADGNLRESSASRPLLKALTRNGSGHPVGYTYVWVRNDERNLYVAMDFTSDNTFDPGDDYAIVHVRTGEAVAHFKVTGSDQRYGRSAFGYTDKAAYEHKTYEFQIPLERIGAASGPIGLAFSVYGTTTSNVPTMPSIGFDRPNNRYLVCLNYQGRQVLCPLLNGNGKVLSKGIFLSAWSSNNLWRPPQIARDNADHRWLVAWMDPDNWEVRAAVVKDGYFEKYALGDVGLAEGSIPLPPSVRIGAGGDPRVAFDPENKVFLVVWSNNGKIKGRFLDAQGNKLGGSFAVFSSENDYAAYPNVAYDSQLNRFLVVFGRGVMEKKALLGGPDAVPISSAQIFGQLVSYPAGPTTRWFAAGEDLIQISSGNMYLGEIPTVVFSKDQWRFLVAWIAPNSEVQGQVIHSFGLPLSRSDLIGLENFTISDRATEKQTVASAADNGGEFLVLWQDGNFAILNAPPAGIAPPPTANIFGQLVGADGSLIGGNFSAFGAKDPNESLGNPSVVFNPSAGQFRSAFDYDPDIMYPGIFFDTAVVKTP